MWRNRVDLTIVGLMLLVACGRPMPSRNARPPAPLSMTASSPLVDPQASSAREDSSDEDLAAEARSSDPVIRKRALARIAIAHAEAGELDEAARAYGDAAAAYPEIRAFLLLRKMDVERDLARFADAADTAREIAAIEPATSATTLARIDLPALLLLAGDTEGAKSAFAFAKEVAIRDITEEPLADLADVFALKGLRDEAAALRMRLLVEYPRGRYTESTWAKLASLPHSVSPLWKTSFDALLEIASDLGSANRNTQALQAVALAKKRFSSRATDSSLRWVEASALFRLRRYGEVTRIHPRVGESRYASLERLRAHAYWRNGNEKAFVRGLESLLRKEPRSREATTARVLLGKYYLTDGDDTSKAAKYLEEAIRSGGAGSEGENLWTLAWIRITAGDVDDAMRDLGRYLDDYPDADYTSNALFWTAKLHERRNESAERDAALHELIDLYPYNYYSYRARQILGLSLDPPGSFPDRKPFPVPEVDRDAPRDSRLEIVDELDAIGLVDEATEQFRRIVGDSNDPRLAYELADRYCRSGLHLQGIRLLSSRFGDVIRHGASDVPNRFWEVLYPLAWWPELVHASNERKVDPYLVAAVIRQESGFNPSAISGAGAVGLMQIMPREIGRIARAGSFHRSYSRQDLFDPPVNLRFGTVELSEKLHEMNDQLVAALAAYNAGEDPVREWLREIPREDDDFFIESIPYSETRLYVKSIIRNRLEYARVYAGPDGASSNAPEKRTR